MNIRSKITLPMILLPLASSVIILIVCILLFSNTVHNEQKEMVTSAAKTFKNSLEEKKNSAEQAAMAIASDNELNEDLIKNTNVPSRTSELKDDTVMDYAVIYDKSGEIIYSTMDEDRTDAYMANSDSVSAGMSGNTGALINPGDDKKLSIQSGAPIYDTKGQLMGVAVTGFFLDDEVYIEEVKDLTGGEASITVGSERVATTIKDDEGKRTAGTKIEEDAWKEVSKGKIYSGESDADNRHANVEYLPLMNGNDVIGMYTVRHYTKDADNTVTTFIIISIIVTLAVLVVAGIVGFIISGRIADPIRRLVGVANRIAKGEVDINLEIYTKDETADLARAFQDMVECFKNQAKVLTAIAAGDYTLPITPESDKDVVGNAIVSMMKNNNQLLAEIRKTSDQVSSGSNQIARAAEELSAGSSEQAATVQKFADSISDLQQQAKNSDHFADKTLEKSKESGSIMKESVEYMQQMSEAMQGIDLGSKNIADIINLIDSIAFQTNILALNAAVEAARAGEHGKGFGVVADEVKNLAARSADAVKETTELITYNIEKVEQGNSITALAEESLAKIAEITENTENAMKEIKNNSSLQAETINGLMKGIEEISSVVGENSAAAEENAASAEEMSAQSQSLDQAISHFKTK